MLRQRLSIPFLHMLDGAVAGIVSAGPGYGKSVFLAELATAWPHEPALRMPRDAAAIEDLAELARRTPVPLLFLLDDAHLLPAEAAGPLERLLAHLPRRHRVVLATRGDDGPVRDVADGRALAVLTARDLRLTREEVTSLLGPRHRAATAVHGATGGWAEGVAMLAAADVATADRALADALVARELRRRLAAAVDGGVSALLAARVPLVRRADGSWQLPSALAAHVPDLAPAPSTPRPSPPPPVGTTWLERRLSALRQAELRGDIDAHTCILVAALADAADAPVVARELLEAERLRGLLARGFAAPAAAGAAALLRRTTADPVRARALDVLARAARRDGGEHRLLLAADLLAESLALWRRLGAHGRVEEARVRLARVDLDLGHAHRALRRAESVAATGAAAPAIGWAARMLRLQALGDLGHAEEPEALPYPGAPSGTAHADILLRAQGALLRDDPEDAVRHLRRFDIRRETSPGALRLARAVFAAELWCRAGVVAEAVALTAWARRFPAERTASVRIGLAAVDARAGDPTAALAAIDALLAASRVPPRDLWRAHLLASAATARAGGSPAPRLDQALRAATAIGQPGAPYIRERELLAEILDTPGVWRSGATA